MVRIAALVLLLAPSLARSQGPYAICDEPGGKWAFCRGGKKVRENAFIRDYRQLTGRSDLDRALKMRNVAALTATGVVAAVGVAEALAGIAVSNALGPGDGLAIGIPIAMWATAGIAFVGGTIGFVIAALFPNGTVRSHRLDRREAAVGIALYNAELDVPKPKPPSGRLRIVPYAGPKGFGIAGSF